MKGLVSAIGSYIADAAFPRFCVVCRCEGSLLCETCRVNWNPQSPKSVCIACEKLSAFGLTCESCLSEAEIDGLVSQFYYADPVVNALIRSWKYHFDESAAEYLFRVAERNLNLLDQFIVFGQPDYITPISLHARRYCERGFDQAERISKWLSEYFDLPAVKLLKRNRYTQSQVERSDQERLREMIKTPFSTIDFVPESVLLIDDVWTTGATAKAAAQVLKRAGAERVYVYTLAKG